MLIRATTNSLHPTASSGTLLLSRLDQCSDSVCWVSRFGGRMKAEVHSEGKSAVVLAPGEGHEYPIT